MIGSGSFITKRTVKSSTFSTRSYFSAPSAKVRSPLPAAKSFFARSNVKTTASALIGSPLWNVRPRLILTSQFSGSTFVIDSATAGTTLPSLSRRNSPSWIDRITFASDCVNIGSRLTGSAFMRTTTGPPAASEGVLARAAVTSPRATVDRLISFKVFMATILYLVAAQIETTRHGATRSREGDLDVVADLSWGRLRRQVAGTAGERHGILRLTRCAKRQGSQAHKTTVRQCSFKQSLCQ